MEGDDKKWFTESGLFISIHSLRVEGDLFRWHSAFRMVIISIHSLRVEGDPLTDEEKAFLQEFQSTPSVWRETNRIHRINWQLLFQSTPSVWRETNSNLLIDKLHYISIHSLRVEGDLCPVTYILTYR